jgi:hypothetical protein
LGPAARAHKHEVCHVDNRRSVARCMPVQYRSTQFALLRDAVF